jgi:hypothetical protein
MDNTDWRIEFEKKMTEFEQKDKEKIAQISVIMKEMVKARSGDQSRLDSLRKDYDRLHEELESLRQGQQEIVTEAMQRIGITEADVEAIEEARRAERGEKLTQGVIQRADVLADNISETGKIEDLLPKSLERLLSFAPSSWISTTKSQKDFYRLGEAYVSNPFSLVSSSCVRGCGTDNRFGQQLVVAEDFLEGREEYDFWQGALTVPQLARLGEVIDSVCDTGQDGKARIRRLFEGHADLVDSTIYEVIVAGACLECGRSITMLEPNRHGKTPDMRITDLPMPFVIECKRRQPLIEYERMEEATVRTLFEDLNRQLQMAGISGIVEADFKIELKDISPTRFTDDVRRHIIFGLESVSATYDWGSTRFDGLPADIHFETTRLYSPNFLLKVFAWNVEQPTFDGIICRADSGHQLIVDGVRSPLALKWRSTSEVAMMKKVRSVSSLFGSALSQMPIGELGAVYLCFQEGAAPEIADERTNRIIQDFRGWTHNWGIRVPVIYINRLFPRPLGDGRPDLIENIFMFQQDGAEVFHDLLPSAVFTHNWKV